MKTISMRITMWGDPTCQKLILALTALAAMAGLGYACWYLVNVLQCWAASSAVAAQILQ